MKTNRAILLPTPGDPYVFGFWLRHYRKVWGSDVNSLHVDLNPPKWTPNEVIEASAGQLLSPLTPGFVSIAKNPMTTHGDAIKRLLERVDTDVVMLAEDDVPVWRKGRVSDCFSKIETGQVDLVGSPRMSCSESIWTATKKKYTIGVQPAADEGPNWWPSLFFARKNDLMATDRDFNAKGWAAGETIKELGLTVTEETRGDTMVWTSIQLRAMGLKDLSIPQFHSHPHDLSYYPSKSYLWSAVAPWVHIGSLSGLLGQEPRQCMFGDTKAFAGYIEDLRKSVSGCNSLKQEMVRRYTWVKMIYQSMDPQVDMGALSKVYSTNLETVIDGLGLDRGTMDQLSRAYKELPLCW